MDAPIQSPYTADQSCPVVENDQECGGVLAKGGMCNKHYIRNRRNGDPLVTLRTPSNSQPFCKVEGCERKFFTHGFCKAHWDRFDKDGDPGPSEIAEAPQQYADDALCSIDDCDLRPKSQGMCKKHYALHRETDPCSIDGCDSPARGARGWCFIHYSRWQKHGDPLVTLVRPDIPDTCTMPGCDNPHRSADLCDSHYKAARYFRPAESSLLVDRVTMFGGRCWICGGEWEAIDHVKPIARGGAFKVVANLRPICTVCNSTKSAKWPYDTSTAHLRLDPSRLP